MDVSLDVGDHRVVGRDGEHHITTERLGNVQIAVAIDDGYQQHPPVMSAGHVAAAQLDGNPSTFGDPGKQVKFAPLAYVAGVEYVTRCEAEVQPA